MNDNTAEPAKETKPKKVTLYSCTVIVPKITVGRIIAGRGAKLRLPKDEADALAALTPPAIRIDGI